MVTSFLFCNKYKVMSLCPLKAGIPFCGLAKLYDGSLASLSVAVLDMGKKQALFPDSYTDSFYLQMLQ